MSQETKSCAIVCRATRRYVDVYMPDFRFLRGSVAGGLGQLCVGDLVHTRVENERVIVTEIQERKNLLQRSSESKTKLLASNIDHLFIVTAPGAICKPATIDRVLIAATAEQIPLSLIWNKTDLDDQFAASAPIREAYQRAGFRILHSSTLTPEGTSAVRTCIEESDYKHIVFTGVSGVGKSSILNTLVGDSMARTQEVSSRSGYGKQTTSEAFGYVYTTQEAERRILCDLPGVQQFGLAHLEEHDIKLGFPEFQPFAASCRFANCMHLAEPECGVLAALSTSSELKQRYASYKTILEERRMYY